MANYLQRIADSGARTSSGAKPPAAARMLIPPVGAPLHPTFDDHASQLSDTSRVPLAPGPALACHESEVETSEPSLREAQRNNEIEMDKSAPMSIPVPSRVGSQSPTLRVAVRAPKALRATVPASPHNPSIHTVAEETIRALAPSRLLNRIANRSSEMSETNISLQPGDNSISIADVAKSGVPLPAAKSAVEITPAQLPVSQIAYPDRADRHPDESWLSDLKSSAPVKHLTTTPVTEIHRLQVVSASTPQAMRSPAKAPESRRRTQLSIGRIEVQVNNQAPQPAPPQPSRTSAGMNILEQRYLNRFFLNL